MSPTPGIPGFGQLYFCLCFICYFVIFVNLLPCFSPLKIKVSQSTSLSSKSSCFPRITLSSPFCSCSISLCLSWALCAVLVSTSQNVGSPWFYTAEKLFCLFCSLTRFFRFFWLPHHYELSVSSLHFKIERDEKIPTSLALFLRWLTTLIVKNMLSFKFSMFNIQMFFYPLLAPVAVNVH